MQPKRVSDVGNEFSGVPRKKTTCLDFKKNEIDIRSKQGSMDPVSSQETASDSSVDLQTVIPRFC